jgi:serine/threonine protein kinase
MATDSSSDRDPVERLAEEYLGRRRRGDRVTLDDYADRYPEWAERIREVFPALEMMERLKPGSADRTGSFDGPAGDGGDGRLERLGDYRILREVGRGGMGVVYEAVQESLGRHVALKVLPIHGRIDPVQMERFRLEARSAAKLHHTHIVPVHGVGEHGGVHYYAMQFIQGCGLDMVLTDLRRLRPGAGPAPGPEVDANEAGTALSRATAESLLAGRATKTWNEGGPDGYPARGPGSGSRQALSGRTEPSYFRSVARIGVQVAEALAHAHGQGVLHRDIKPSNLLLDADGEVWVTDFGLAKLEGSDGPTRTGDVVGTLRYMAPERFDGWSDPRSDVYGLGMTLYELLTLRPAYEATTRARLVERVLHAEPPAPRSLDPKIPRDLETVVLKAIAKEPGERYPTAAAIAEDLKNFLAGRPIRARRVGTAERAWRWCRRNPAAAGLVGASVVAAMALVGIVVGLIDNARVRGSEREAVAARRAEAQERKKAEGAAESERRLGYFHRIVLAEWERQGNNANRAEQLLDQCPTDLRGWEWHYLKQVCHSDFLTITGHTGQVFGVAFSPDGKRIASAGTQDRSVRISDTTNLQEITSFDGLDGWVSSVAFSPDGKRLATGVWNSEQGQPGSVRIWDLETRKHLTLHGHVGAIWCVSFSPDGGRIASASGDRTVRIWDANTGVPIKTLGDPAQGFTSVAFSRDGKYLASATGNRDEYDLENRPGVITIRDATTWKEVRSLEGHSRSVNSVAFSPDGGRLASASSDRTVKIWDTDTGHELSTLRGNNQFFVGVAFSPDGNRLVSASEDGTLRVWDTRSEE